MNRRPKHLTFANIVACLALFVALGGASYAAIRLPKNSVGAKQIKANAVNSGKVKNRSLKAVDFKQGQLPTGARGPQGLEGLQGPQGQAGAPGPPGVSGYERVSKDLENEMNNRLHRVRRRVSRREAAARRRCRRDERQEPEDQVQYIRDVYVVKTYPVQAPSRKWGAAVRNAHGSTLIVKWRIWAVCANVTT